MPKRETGRTAATVAILPWARWKSSRAWMSIFGQAVAVGAHEGVAVDERFDPLHASAGHRVGPGIDQRDAEVLLVMGPVVLDFPAARPQGDGEIVAHGLVIEEVLADDVAAIAQAEDEFAEAVVGIGLHDMPEDRPAAHLDHRFGAELGFLAQAGAEPAAEYHDFGHCQIPWGRGDGSNCNRHHRPAGLVPGGR